MGQAQLLLQQERLRERGEARRGATTHAVTCSIQLLLLLLVGCCIAERVEGTLRATSFLRASLVRILLLSTIIRRPGCTRPGRGLGGRCYVVFIHTCSIETQNGC